MPLQPLLRVQQAHKVCKVLKAFRVETVLRKAQLAVKDPKASKVHKVCKDLKESARKVCRVFKVMVSKVCRAFKVSSRQDIMDKAIRLKTLLLQQRISHTPLLQIRGQLLLHLLQGKE